jgi:hypothetical protein
MSAPAAPAGGRSKVPRSAADRPSEGHGSSRRFTAASRPAGPTGGRVRFDGAPAALPLVRPRWNDAAALMR